MGVGKVIGMTPAGSAYKGVKSLANSLGLGGLLGGKDHRADSLKSLRKAMKKGDVATVMRKAANSKFVRVRGIAAAALAGAGDFAQSKAAYQGMQAMRKAGASWAGSPGAVPVAAAPFSAVPPPVLLAPAGAAAPAAPRPKPPCAYGPRGADGYCPKKPPAAPRALASGSGASTPRAARPCAYGPRGADGYCPKKPAAARTSRAATAARRRAETAVTSAVTRGAKAGVGALGGAAAVGGLLLKASLVGAAGFGAYWLTSKLQKLRFSTYDELRYEAANAYREARSQAALQAGRGLTPAENAQLAQYYKQRIALLNQYQAEGRPIRGLVNLTFED